MSVMHSSFAVFSSRAKSGQNTTDRKIRLWAQVVKLIFTAPLYHLMMLLWEVKGREGQTGWIAANSRAEASDIARHEGTILECEPIEWKPGLGGKIFWLTQLEPDKP